MGGHLVDLGFGQVWVVQDVVQQTVSMILQVSHLLLQHHTKPPWVEPDKWGLLS